MPAAEEAFSSAEPRSAGSEPQTHAPEATAGVLVLKITPLGAFAAGALVVSALALALAVGRRHPLSDGRNTPVKPQVPAESLEEIRNRNPVQYETLQVDRGMAQ